MNTSFNPYILFCVIIVMALAIHVINDYWLKLQGTIAMTLGAVLVSLIIILSNQFGLFDLSVSFKTVLQDINFQDLLLNGMLGFLLFAGALTVDLKSLLIFKWEVGILATFSTLISTFLIGFLIYFAVHLIGLPISLLEAMLFGALISPTDPIAVLATMKAINAPKDLSIKVAGESLFNDGVGLVIFVTLLSLLIPGKSPTISGTIFLFFREAIGGLVYGAVLGAVSYFVIRRLSDTKLQILMTLSVASAGYVLAQSIGISGPLAMVVAGLITGNIIREKAFSEHGRSELSAVWEVIEELLNAVLFLLIGLELILLEFHFSFIIAGLIAIVIALLARLITVAVPMTYFKKQHKKEYSPYAITILTWGGLRGGLALAMALSLPETLPDRGLILCMTYGVVIFSIVIQGLSAKPLVELSKKKSGAIGAIKK